MKTKPTAFTAQYAKALLAHLKKGAKASKASARQLGGDALKRKILILDLAKIHHLEFSRIVEAGIFPKNSAATIKQAGLFFAETIKPIEETHLAVTEARKSRDEQINALRSRTGELLLSNRELKKEVSHRKSAEVALKKSELLHKVLLVQSNKMQEKLRYLTHQILLENEEQRREISRELHDEIAQILAGINVHLASLKVESSMNSKDLSKKITNTQKLVERSVKIVHRFACQLRPTVLDDLGIIPALNTYVKDFTKRTGILIHFRAFQGVEQLNATKRTVLFRIAQAALANVAQHSGAKLVTITIKKLSNVVCMRIHDDGKSFEAERVLSSKLNEHLGLIGMRERAEMVGGCFSVESNPGLGTTIFAEIPSLDNRRQQHQWVNKRRSLFVN